jgi:hypothetical protein
VQYLISALQAKTNKNGIGNFHEGDKLFVMQFPQADTSPLCKAKR